MWFVWGIIYQRFQIETTHQRNTNGKKPFSCPMCGSQFYFSTRMKDHTNRVHEGTKPVLFDSCEESFAKGSKLKSHIKGMQGGKKLFSCPMCGSQFYFSTTMQDHIEKNHKSQDFTVSDVWKSTLLEFMKAQSHSYVILVRNHLPKIPNWNYKSKEC